MANSVWALSDELLVEHTRPYNESNAQHWLFYMMETLPHDQFTQMIVILWAIWTSRRKEIHKEIFQRPISTKIFINNYLDELRGLSKPGLLLKFNNQLLDKDQCRSHPYQILRRLMWCGCVMIRGQRGCGGILS
jgi:hypothetical protein